MMASQERSSLVTVNLLNCIWLNHPAPSFTSIAELEGDLSRGMDACHLQQQNAKALEAYSHIQTTA